MIQGPAGKVALETSLPPELRDFSRVWTADTTKKVLTHVALQDPDRYPDVANDLLQLGRIGASHSGAYPFSLNELVPSPILQEYRQDVEKLVKTYLSKKSGMDTQDSEFGMKLYELTNKYYDKVVKDLESRDNPVYKVVAAKIRGNPMILKRFFLSEGTYGDTWGRPIPYPIYNNFAVGMSPSEYWASAYGSKQGIVTTKLAPGDAGYIYKQMAQLAHKLMVIKNKGKEVGRFRGMPVKLTGGSDDEDNIGAILAVPVAGFQAGTVITPAVLEKLRSKKIDEIVVKSPIAGGPPEGLYAESVGVRGGDFPQPGALVGLEAAQALGERISQSSVGKKHQGAVVGGISSATETIQRLLNPPKNYPGGAAHATVDGKVTNITKAPAGGYYVYVGSQAHYVPFGAEVKVKIGNTVEAGDVLSSGLPNPSLIIQYKGIGEGRRYFTDLFTETLRSFGFSVHRRNVEIISRGLINFVQFNKSYGKYLPGDLVPYNMLEHYWKPRSGSEEKRIDSAAGMYLEEPVLHYTVGTRITPSVLNTLKRHKIDKVLVHSEPPPFSARTVRAVDVVLNDPDWLVKLFGSYQKRSLQEAAAYGGLSQKYINLSFVPALAEGKEFGKKWPQEVLPQ